MKAAQFWWPTKRKALDLGVYTKKSLGTAQHSAFALSLSAAPYLPAIASHS